MITGLARGVRLLAPGEGTRPLSDRTKEALFAALESQLGDAWPVPVLDLFAGSGAAGIEALSRGAPTVVFVEHSQGAAHVIAENLRRVRLPGGHVVRRNALGFLDEGATAAATGGLEGVPFGAAIVDPPYADTRSMSEALLHLGDPSRGWLRDDAVVVAKHFWRDAPPERAGRLLRDRVRRIGETALSFYRVEVAITASGDPEAASVSGDGDAPGREEPTRP